MSKYTSGTLYKGNLMQYVNGKNETVKENIILVYNVQKDVFEDFEEVYYPSLSLIADNLTDIQKEGIVKLINSHSYPYINNMFEGNKYIDESSISVFVDLKKDKRKK